MAAHGWPGNGAFWRQRLADLATLITAFAAGAALGLVGAGYELLTSSHKHGLPGPLAVGLGTALICALVVRPSARSLTGR
jgi:hypothetical protein